MKGLKIAAVIAVIVLLAANTVLLAGLAGMLSNVEVSLVETTSTLSNVEASLEEATGTLSNVEASLAEVEANTAPAAYAEAFCENDALLSEMYDEMVYDGADNINQQAHRQREFRSQVLIFCNR